jgi:quinol monooxygenase YgiN
MTVTALLDLHVQPDQVDAAHAVIRDTLQATRAFAGCLGVDVVIDVEDPAHILLVEKWESLDADLAYRAWRATPEGASSLGTVLAARPTLTKFADAPSI